MVFHPLVIALFVASLLISFMGLYASYFAVQILRKWDLDVDAAPGKVKQGVAKEEAQNVKRELEESGATVELA